MTVPKPDKSSYELPDTDQLKAGIEKSKTYDCKEITKNVLEGRLNILPYADLNRLIYLALHFTANIQGHTAPAFRSMLSSYRSKGHSLEEELIDRDRQLIDIHYLYCNHRQNITLGKPEYIQLLGIDLDEFDYDKAAVFVATRAKAETKAHEHLAIPDLIQFELSFLRCENVRNKMKSLRTDKQTIARKVLEKQGRASSRLTGDKARQIISDVLPLLLASGSPSDAVRYKGLIKGVVFNLKSAKAEARKISESKQWLKRNCAGKF